ncbi:GNAT family N-acetyltransferase [Pseudomonas agarici]|uniref:GNAT family N-acetyltransferase n=1 Tax=Pseudomonas agarici TaxID=46677 RepID=UPI00036BA1EB|nr:GNAT family protein [Pseudomonas agarici]NWB90531.1 GNAT family N-acetyltransferase [Pseudomonas agarici]NWC10979.1 GNAT family N-acetyltransferase [Pseudomonas agarici]SEL35080.1 Protein N-acetyltransferase, RimJ/RimL family [Pseudomonas agarici]
MSVALPHLSTRRLLLMPLQTEQAQTSARLADKPTIADNTAALPSPHTVENALEFIGGQEEQYRSTRLMGLGIHLRENRELVGVISLRFSPAHDSAHLGYWVGAQHRNRGYAGEAVGAMLKHGFVELKLHRIAGQCFRRNKTSARVLDRAGPRHQGCLKGAFLKNRVYEDMLLYGLLHDHWQPLT